MYCPTCGSEERQPSQFCRACGTDMRAVRRTLESPDDITASAVSARDQIGLAIAEKIREVESTRDLKHVTEDVLPQIEKFLESPEERRLRTARAGVVTAVTGLGTGILALLLLTMVDNGALSTLLVGGVGLSVIMFLVGLGLVFNGIYFTIPRKGLPLLRADPEADNAVTDRLASTGQLLEPAKPLSVSSVTEHTTHHLSNKS
ncbi:MAG TPA: zinc ribbon domain-containing protein [Pyrinomonadaceae bacterium]